jgi:hypothetical protein
MMPTHATPGTTTKATQRKAAPRLSPERVHDFVRELLGDDVHATRVLSFANGVVGVLRRTYLIAFIDDKIQTRGSLRVQTAR